MLSARSPGCSERYSMRAEKLSPISEKLVDRLFRLPCMISSNISPNAVISWLYAETSERLFINGTIIAALMPIETAATMSRYISSLYVTLKLSISTFIVCLNFIYSSFCGRARIFYFA